MFESRSKCRRRVERKRKREIKERILFHFSNLLAGSSWWIFFLDPLAVVADSLLAELTDDLLAELARNLLVVKADFLLVGVAEVKD